MPCSIPVEEGVKSAADCRCYGAVMRAYNALSNEEPHKTALAAAQRVYRHHHPEDTKHIANLTVESWINESRVQ